MTDDNAFKRKARKHQEATGESYLRARRQVDKNHASDAYAGRTDTLLRLLTGTTLPPLRIPLGLQADDTPVWLDLRDEADGGNGPHGFIVGAEGSGKSNMLASLIFAMCARHSPDQVQFILADPRKNSIFDDFAGYPHVRATLTDLARVDAKAARFVDTIQGVLDERARTLHDNGIRIIGTPFTTLDDYHQAQPASDATMPPVPNVFVVVDDLAALRGHHPAIEETVALLTRKGRALGVHLVASTPTLGHPLPRDVLDNCVFRIALRTTTEAESRRMIGTTEAAHLPNDQRGVGWLTTPHSAFAVRFTSFRPSRAAITAAARRFTTEQS